MSCCECCLISFIAILGLVYFIPHPDHFQVSEYQPSPVKNLEDLGIPLDQFKSAKYIKLPGKGPQDIEIDSKGNAYTGLMDGTLLKINIQTQEMETLAKFQSQILGLALSPNQRYLATANHHEGLVLFDLQKKTWKTLASQYNGNRFKALNSITFSSDNKIYFTVSGQIQMKVFHKELLYKTKQGKIYTYDIKKDQIQLIIDQLSFPNGIAYLNSQNSLLVNELNYHRVLKFSLNSHNYLNKTIITESSYTFMDNFKLTEDEFLWVGAPSLRDQVTNLIDKYASIRRLLINLRIPTWLFMGAANFQYSGGIKIDPRSGQIVQFLFGKPKDMVFTTCINQKKGKLVVGSRVSEYIAIIERKFIETASKYNQSENNDL